MTQLSTYLGRQTDEIRELVEQGRTDIVNTVAAVTQPAERPIAFIEIPKFDQMTHYAESLWQDASTSFQVSS